MKQVRAERAVDPTMENVPGGKTGLIVRDFKSVGNGPSARVVPVYEEDHGWFKTVTGLQDQARKILGKDTQRIEVTVRKEAERLAAELGISVEQVMNEAKLLEAGSE